MKRLRDGLFDPVPAPTRQALRQAGRHDLPAGGPVILSRTLPERARLLPMTSKTFLRRGQGRQMGARAAGADAAKRGSSPARKRRQAEPHRQGHPCTGRENALSAATTVKTCGPFCPFFVFESRKRPMPSSALSDFASPPLWADAPVRPSRRRAANQNGAARHCEPVRTPAHTAGYAEARFSRARLRGNPVRFSGSVTGCGADAERSVSRQKEGVTDAACPVLISPHF